MNDYINKDYYKQLSAADRHFINLSYAAASELVDRLNAENIPFSAAVGDFKNVITVSKSNAERVKQLTDEIAENSRKRRRIIGNTEYRYIPDKKYIDTDPETAEQLATLLSGDSSRKFSGVIDGDKATITVSGEKNAADIRRMIENIKNSDLISEMKRSGFERIADSDGFINIRSSNTGEVCGFADLATVRNMFVDPDNEFFHPVETAYRIDLTTDAFADAYYISEYNTSDGTEKDMYFDKDGNIPTFTTIDEALAYIADNNIAVTNTAEQLNSWRNDDADRENEAISEANNQLIQQFPKRGEAYPDDITYNPDSGNYTWIFFNPDGNNGQGEFAEKTITPQDIYEAYAERITAKTEDSGRDAFIDHLFSVCSENIIDTYSGYFADYANDYISKPENTERFYGIAPNGNAQDIDTFIERLESSCPAVEEDKLRQEELMENSPMGNNIPLSEQLISITEEISRKQTEFTGYISTGNYESAGTAAAELAELSQQADRIKNEIRRESIKREDVDTLRSIKPERKSVQNMLENEVAQTPKFEKLLNDEMGEKSAYEMRNGNLDWRNDSSKYAPIINVENRTIPTNISEMRQDKKIERGTFINHDTGLEIIFGKRSVEEITAKAIQDNKRGIPTDARLSALYQIKELIENSVCFDSQLSDYDTETSKNKSPNTLFMHKLYGVLKHENEYYLANLTVEESYFTDKEDKFKDTSNRMYSFRDIKITPIEAHRIFSPAVNNKNVAEDTSTDVIGITIPQLYELVKTYDRNFFENPAAPGRPEREAEMQAQSEYKNAVEKYNEHNSQNIDISKALDLDNNTITFSVITIDDEEPFIVGSHIDVEDIPDLEEYQDYIYDTGKTITDVKVEYYQIGNGDHESYDAYGEERTFISEHLEAVLSYHGTDCLESEIFSVEAPNELLEEINEEKEISAERAELEKAKNYITEFLDSEYSSTADFSDMRHISIGYTEIGSEEQGDHPLQVEADLESFSVSYYIDEKLAKTEKYDSLEQMNREHLSVLSFEDMLHVGTTELDRILDEKAVMEHSSGNDVPTPEQREEIVRKNNTLNSFFNNNPLAVFREIIKSAGLEPTEDISIGETKKIFDSLKSVDISLMGYTYALEFESHDDRLSVTDTASGRTEDFLWGHAKELMYLIANENNISRENLIHNEVMRGTGFEGGKFRTADFYQTNPSMKDFADFLKNEYGIGGHSGNGPVRFVNYDAKGIEIETSSGKENFTWTEAAKVITDLINKDEYITQKDIDDRVRHSNSINEARHILNKYGAKEPVPQNIMDIILDDIPSLMKSAVAWDELMEYGGIAEQFEHGKDPIEVVKSYISNNGSFSYSPDELNKLDKSLHCSWSAEDNGNNAVITVNVTNLDTYSKYESQFTMPWTEIADAFKTRIDQERNYNRLADREITVSSIAGTDKYRFVDIENNIDEVKSREELTALFSKMFNKSELEAIIRNYVDLAPTEEYKIPQPNEINHKNTYEIYQIPTGERYHDIRYASFEHLGIMGQLPDRMNYEKVYSGELDDIKSTDKLEGLFAKFNMDRPNDYTGRSLSVSDVIVINDENGSTAHFVDDIGYKDITDTFLELNSNRQSDRANETININAYKDISIISRSEWNDNALSDTENPAFEEKTASYSPEEDGSFTKYSYNRTNSSSVDIWDEESRVSGEELLADIKNQLDMMNRYSSSDNRRYQIELTDYDGNIHHLENSKYTFVLGEKPKQEHSGPYTAITQNDVDILRTLPPRKSILNFTEEERALTAGWAEHFKNDIAEKSPFFRAENGDWRADDNSRTPIQNIDNHNVTNSSVKNDIKSNSIFRGMITNSDTDWNIQVSRKGLEDTYMYAVRHNDPITLNALYHIDKIIESSILLDTNISEHNNKNKSPDTLLMHKLYAPVKFNNEIYIAKLTVEEFFNGNMKNPDTIKRLYNLQDIKIEPLRHLSLTDEQLHLSVLNGTDISIADLFHGVKSCDEDFYMNAPERSNVIESNRENSNSPLGNTYEPKINDIISIDDTAYRISDITDNMIALTAMDSLFAMPEYKSMADFLSSGFTVIEENTEAHAEPSLPHSDSVPDNRLPEEKNTENFVIDNDNIGVSGGAKARYADNAAAIKTLKAIEAEGRTATPEEQQILAKYTGWGAIPQAFDANNEKWSTEYTELKTILTPDEYAAARKSTMNAHYTSPTVISAIYDGLRNLGFESGKILEPAMGIGNFFGAMPDDMRSSKLYGVELDSLTGRIAQQLYPSADIQIKGFEETTFADNSFDIAIGNVPFGDYKLNDKKYNDNNFLIHDYFFAKSLDKVRPGGIVAFVTSKGTLDKENTEVRKYIAERAELLGAVRLPNNAFKANAGTEVTSDIIFLRKRDRPIEINPDNVEWLKKAETPDGFSVNNYFVQHPEMVLGKIVEGNKMFGSTNDTSCVPIEGADLKQQLAEAIKNIHGEYKAAEIETAPINADEIDAPENSRKYAYYAVNGNLYYREAEDTMKKVTLPQDTLNRAIGLIALRDNVHELLNLQLNNSDGTLDGDIADSREKLNKSYDSFVAKYGNVSDKKNAKAMQGDNGYNIVSALEVKNEKGQVTGKADIFEHNTVKPKIIAAHVESAEEALILSVSEKGRVDFDFMTEHSGIEKDKLISELHGQIFRLPQAEEKYVTADEYLSGNIRKKLIELNNAPDGMNVSENRNALEAAMPPRVEAKDISVKLGSHWIDPEYIKQFMLEKLSPDYETRKEMEVQYSSVAGAWKIEGVKARSKNNYASRHTYGTERKHAYEIIEGILNNSDLLVKDRMKDAAGNEMRDPGGNYILITNDEETKAVRHCANLIKSEFQDWIFKDPERREELVQKYNDTYNSIRHREYDGSHLNFAGMNTDITLKEHQKNAVARALYGGNTLLAHAVGAGKSYEMIAIAMEGKRLGLHNKSLFAVPNSLTEQMGNDFRKLYPNANILVATKKDFERPNRLKLLAKIASNDWDAVIVGHSQFDRMGLSPEREKKYLTSEINKLREELEKAAADNIGNGKSFTVKAIEKSLAKYEDKLEKLNDGQVKDDFIDFEEMGFDKLFVDESHTYKNLATPTKMHNVSGLGSQGSARAFGLLMKGKYLDEMTGGKGMVFASGTPVSNSMTELYTLMRYLQADLLKDCNINHFDEWAADFGEVRTDYELKPESDGKYQLKTRFAKFTNLPELMGMFKEAADIRTADTLNLDKPKAIVSEVVAQPSKIQKKAIKALGKRAAQIRSGNVDPTRDNMLCITNDGRKIGLDQRLLNPNLPDDPNSKVNLCVKNVLDIYNKTADKRSTQCIFCDMSTPKSETRQDRFLIYRPDAAKALGYDVIRKKTGIKADTDFNDIKKYIDKAATEAADKLQNGDIAVIRRPSEDMTHIISEAAVYKNGKFISANSAELLEHLEMSTIEDMPPKEFNIYDDIKDKLMKQGVPEKEIAFIHDYDTAEQKQKLFNQMNAGDVRILLGSTSKCGAGMNAQKKMIALHHLDAPMRPSDMEQRNGRIERQGNENPEVQIFRYVTDKTFDSYLYQMLENKQKFISQVMTSKTPERTCADIDEAALDYAEVKALCAGNPLIKEEMELQSEIKDLKMGKSRYSENIFDLQDKIRVKIPAAIQQTEAHIESFRNDFSLANNQQKVITEDGKAIYPIKIGDTVYNDRTAGGDALKAAIGGNIGKLAEGKTVPVGEYRGMQLSLLFDTMTKTTKACLAGEKHHYCDLNPETNTGNIIRLDNLINNMEKDIKQSQETLETMHSELAQMKIDVEKPFPKADELLRAETRLEEVHDQLTKLELTDDTANKDIFERFCTMFPEVINGEKEAVKYEAGEAFDPLSVELHGNVFSMAHTYTQNGDLMYDPLVYFKLDFANEKAIPISFENSGMGVYQEFDIDAEPTAESVHMANDVLDFVDTWLDNIDEQGYLDSEPQEKTKETNLSVETGR